MIVMLYYKFPSKRIRDMYLLHPQASRVPHAERNRDEFGDRLLSWPANPPTIARSIRKRDL